MTDHIRYNARQRDQERQWEEHCQFCGMCCGLKDQDPCVKLVRQKDQRYFCSAYAQRLGPQRTKAGHQFVCVPIREILHQDWPGQEQCNYRRILRK